MIIIILHQTSYFIYMNNLGQQLSQKHSWDNIDKQVCRIGRCLITQLATLRGVSVEVGELDSWSHLINLIIGSNEGMIMDTKTHE